MAKQPRQALTDLVAGLTGAVAGTPQAMGFALIAGINPVFGLYTAMVSTITASLFSSSHLMTIAPTNALALVVASTLAPFIGPDQVAGLFVLTLLVGLLQVGFGLLRLGALARFVSHAVMIGFITGASVLIALGQLRYLNGYTPAGDTPLARAWDWLLNLPAGDLPTMLLSVLTLAITLGVKRTRWRALATLAGIGVASAVVLLAGWDHIPIVRSIASIPYGLPAPALPDIRLAPDLLAAAVAIAILGAVQSVGITSTLHNPGGERPDPNRDFVAMGIANCVGATMQCMPVCGSLSRTAVNVMAGARTRWANVVSGVFVGLFLLAFGSVIEYVVLCALAVQLVIAAVSLIDTDEIIAVWRVAPASRLAMVATFVATLTLPLEYSIYVGVAISLALYVYASAEDVRVERLVPVGERFRVEPVPAVLSPNEVVVLSVHGNLYFAAIAALERKLPAPEHAHGATIILRLRDDAFLASTGLQFLARYDAALQRNGGELVLTGLSPALIQRLQQPPYAFPRERLYPATPVIFEGTARAYADALARRTGPPPNAQSML
jgi:SulP family sulfate permease